MGLFNLFKFGVPKRQEYQKTEEDLRTERLEWFFTEEAKEKFELSVKKYEDEMYEVWKRDVSEFIMYTSEKGSPNRIEYPCTIIADYLRALDTMTPPCLSVDIAHLIIEGCGDVQWPDCLKAEHNPLINFAIKIKPLYHCKNGKDIEFDSAMRMMIFYLHDAFLKGYDESNEEWIYEKSLWYNKNGKAREYYDIIRDIEVNVKHRELLIYP